MSEADLIEDNYAYCPNWKEAHYNMARLGPRYNPIDVFKKFDDHRRPIEKLMNGSGMGALTGFFVPCVAQYNAGKPVFSQFHRHIIGIIVGFIGGYAVTKYAIRKTALEQSRIMHYIEAKPEYFPPIDRYKYKDTLGSYRMTRIYR